MLNPTIITTSRTNLPPTVTCAGEIVASHFDFWPDVIVELRVSRAVILSHVNILSGTPTPDTCIRA